MSIILGIDPGSQVTGFGIIQVDDGFHANESRSGQIRTLSHGIIKLKSNEESFNQRLKILAENLSQLLIKYKPDEVAIEKIFLGKNPDSAFKLGHARGVCIQKSMEYGAKVFEYSTREVKKSITGSGGADKTQVSEVLKHLLQLKQIEYLDASDALALAFHHGTQKQIEARFKIQI